MKSMNIAALVLIISLFLSLLSGLNQVAGFFSRVSLATAILSGVLAIIIAVTFPELLRRKRPSGEKILKMSFRVFCILLAVVILVVGVGPFLGKFWIATQAKSQGSEFVDRHLYAPARIYLARATHYFEDLGFSKRAVESKLILSQVYAGLGDRARAEELIQEIEDSGFLDTHQQGKLYTIRGIIAYEWGEFEQAEHFYQLAHQTIEPRSQVQAILLQNQAVLWAGKGAPFRERVLDNYRRAREIYQELNDEIGLVHVLINEGNLYENDPHKARTLYEQAQSEAEKIQDPYLIGTIAMNIGVTYRQQGDLEQAEKFYNQARWKFEEAADFLGQAQVLVNLAVMESVRGHMELARQHVQASEAYLRNIDLDSEQVQIREVAQIRTFQADIYDSFGESEAAESYYEEALTIFTRYPDPLREAKTRVNYGGLLLRLNRGQEALQQIGRAREILEAYSGEGPHQSLAVLYNNLGRAYQDMGDFDNALNYYGKAMQIFEDLEELFLHAQARENKGIVRIWLGDDRGLEDILEALKIYRELENRDHEAQTLFNLYSLYGAWGEPSAVNMVPEILELLNNYNIDQETEAGILFGILVQDIGSQAELITYRERLLQLKMFYEQRDEPIGLGRSLLKLANIEQFLGNFSKMIEYAREAEVYAEYIPLPLRMSFHTDLGFFLVQEYPEDGIDHFLEAFDLAHGISIDQQRNLAIVIQTYLLIYADEVDRDKYRIKSQEVLRTVDDTGIQSMFKELIDVLS